MKQFHPLSFVLGIVSGALLLLIGVGTMHALHPAPANRFVGGGAPNTARMAQRLGISEDELQKELQSGKTMQQIAQEHGVTFGAGGGGGFRNGGSQGSGSGTQTVSSAATTSLSSQ